jgi:hypothetical protein
MFLMRFLFSNVTHILKFLYALLREDGPASVTPLRGFVVLQVPAV